jgi:hypothetical protein
VTEPSQRELTDTIAEATRNAVVRLFREHPGHFYYCSLITTGEANAPFLSAWSEESLDATTTAQADAASARHAIKWSYADSPFCDFASEQFEAVRALFLQRPVLDPSDEMRWMAEWQLRVDAMEAAMARLDAEGVFGRGQERARIVINVEVMPPDHTNTERAIRLNPRAALENWLKEAAEA